MAAGVAGTNRALVFLLQLRFRGALRRMQRTVSTPKGMALAAVGGFFILAWLASYVLTGQRSDPGDLETVRRWIPLLILLMLATGVLRVSADRSISFSPAEIDFLFTGPFSRRQILLYKIAVLALITLLSSSFAALVAMTYIGSAVRAFPGIFSALLLVQLFSVLVAMLRERLGQVFTGRLGWGVGALILLLAGSGLIAGAGPLELGDSRALLEAIRSGPGWRALEIALAPFTIAITASTAGGLALALAGTMAINGAVLGAILMVDANYLEAASRISERTYARMQEVQTQGLARIAPNAGRRRVPHLPHWGGAGTVAWRQLTALRRGSLGLVIGLLACSAVAGGWLAWGTPEALLLVILGPMLFPFVVMVAESLRFDFRGDYKALEGLKAMPLHPIPLAAGQIAIPTVLLAVAGLAIVGPPLIGAGYGGFLPLVAILFLMVGTLMFGVKNCLFLHFPVNIRERNPADPRFLGRAILFFTIEGVVVMVAVGVSAVGGFLGSALAAAVMSAMGITVSLTGMVAVGGVAFVALLCAPVFTLLWLTGRAFASLDPSRLLTD